MGLKAILASVAATATLALAKPGTIEVDLIFPRNETYKPDPVFPLVFSFRDANNASAHLDGFVVGWALYPDDGSVHFNKRDGDEVDEPPASFRSGMITLPPGGQDAAQYVWDSIEGPTSNATRWWLTWVPIANCTGEGGDEMEEQVTSLYFTTADQGSKYDIVPKDCKNLPSYVMNITAHSGDEAAHGSADPYCGYADGPLPEADPCGAKISSDEAQRIINNATSKACHADNPVVSCPSNSGASMLATNGLVLLAGASIWALLSTV